MKTLILALIGLIMLPMLSACSDADMASNNLSRAAEEFEITRRTIFYNGITGEYILTVEGLCSVDTYSGDLELTCKVGPKKYVKHFLGLSDNVTWFSEQTESANVDVYHHRIIFKPDVILPSFEVDSALTGGN